jgi:thiamine-phosphate pyrophosphorylase
MTETQDCRLYLVTPPLAGAAPDDLEPLAESLDAALAAGDVACVLLRTAALDGEAVSSAVERLRPPVQARDVAFVLEGFADLAYETGCDGTHLTWDRRQVAAARGRFGPDGIVGVCCGNSRHPALEAGEAGVDYVAFGAGPDLGEAADPELLAWWQEVMTPVCVAMGPLTLAQVPALAQAGADFIALGDTIWEHREGPAAAVEKFHTLLAGALR